jgi:DNA-binding transcriptional LysR family regulator
MELRHLRYFVAVAEELHFTRAADRLNMSQPPLSQRIMELERELQVTLFERTRRRVELTAVGGHFLDCAREVLARLDAGVEAVRQIARNETGHLVIGWEPLVELGSIPRLIQGLRQQYPAIRVEVRTLVSTDLLRALRDGRIDAAFVSPPESQDDLTVHVLEREPLLAVLPDGHRLANRAAIPASELAVECHVRLAPHVAPALARCVAALWTRERVEPVTELEVDTPLSMLRLVGRGTGVALIPASAIVIGIPGCVYRPLAGQVCNVETGLVVARGETSPSVRQLVCMARGAAAGQRARAA